MTHTARPLTLLAVFFCLTACAHRVASVASSSPAPSLSALAPTPPPSPDALQSSPRTLVGRILAIDASRGFAFVATAPEAPSAALAEGAELLVRTDDFRETARLRVSPYVRSRTLGTQIIAGQPSPGDEVVYPPP